VTVVIERAPVPNAESQTIIFMAVAQEIVGIGRDRDSPRTHSRFNAHKGGSIVVVAAR